MRAAATVVLGVLLGAACATTPRPAAVPAATAGKAPPPAASAAPKVEVVSDRRSKNGRQLELKGPYWGVVEFIDALPADEVVPELRLRTLFTAEQVVLSAIVRLGGDVPEQARASVTTDAVVARMTAIAEAIPRKTWLDAYQENEGGVWFAGRSVTEADVGTFLKNLGREPCRFRDVDRRSIKPDTVGQTPVVQFTATAVLDCR